MTKEDLKLKIQDKFPKLYEADRNLDKVADMVCELPVNLRNNLENFLDAKSYENVEIEGYTVSSLKKKHGMNEIAAFLTLGWLTKDPKEAKVSLQKGNDFITSGKHEF